MKFNVGDKVVPNLKEWISSEFDQWIKPNLLPVGEIVESPFALDAYYVDVKWPDGRAFQHITELIKHDKSTENPCN